MRDVGIPAYDFGENWEGWQREQQMVHPNKVHFRRLLSRLFARFSPHI